ncbi:hypothetical protein DFJ73DRAFT_880348 [Zopfochytrium polystomum]|nr:hypothetical protein DFJ73DRAFT_880348 [Zopfochytrium polystomum]
MPAPHGPPREGKAGSPTGPIPPSDLAAEICIYVAHHKDRFYLATLLRLLDVQAASFRHLHRFEFNRATATGDERLLDLLLRQALADNREPTGYTEEAINEASAEGRIAMLQWWKESGLPLKYGSRAIVDASFNGHIKVLHWWKKSGLALEYSTRTLDSASACGRTDLLQWWKDSRLKLEYSKWAMHAASEWGHVPVLQWWVESGLKLKYDIDAVDVADRNGHSDVVEWWRDSKLFEASAWKAWEASSKRRRSATPEWRAWLFSWVSRD